MEAKSKYLLRNTSILMISNFSSKIFVFFLVPLYTSVLTTSEYGTYDLMMSTVSLLYPVLTLNIVDAVMRFTMDDTYPKKKVVSIGFRYIAISIGLTALITSVLHICNVWDGLLKYFILYYIFYVLNQLLLQFAKGMEKVNDMAIAGFISTLVTLSSNILLLLIFKLGVIGFFAANILSQVISGGYLLIRLKVWEYIEIKKQDIFLRKQMLLYSVPLITTTLGWWVNNSLDRCAVSLICGIDANGLLSISYKIPTILTTVQNIFIQAWAISAIKEYGESNTNTFYGKAFSFVNLVMCVTCSGLILLTRPLATILYAKEFYAAWKYVPFLLISTVFGCASGLLGPVLSAKKDTKTMMWSAIIGAGVNAILNIGLIYLIGIQGATIATAISSLVIYIVRRYGVAKDIIIEDKYYLTWILLTIQAAVEIMIEYWIIEIVICIIMIGVNYKNIATAIKIAKRVMRR